MKHCNWNCNHTPETIVVFGCLNGHIQDFRACHHHHQEWVKGYWNGQWRCASGCDLPIDSVLARGNDSINVYL